jgi:hypothetical protein
MILTVQTTIPSVALSHSSGLVYSQDDCQVEVEVDYIAGSPGRQYMPNGDPGYPDEPGEMEIISIFLMEEMGFTNYLGDLIKTVEMGSEISLLLQDAEEDNPTLLSDLDDRVWDLAIDAYSSRAEDAACEKWESQQEARRDNEY